MCNEQECDAGFLLQLLEFHAHCLAQLQVQRRQRFVQKQHPWLRRKRARQRHALLLSAGKLRGETIGQRGKMNEFKHAPGARAAGHRVDTLHLQSECDIVDDRHVRKQSVVLENRVYRPQVGLKCCDILTEEKNFSLSDFLKPGNHPQERGLSTSRRAEEGEESVVRDVEGDAIKCRCRAITLYGVANTDCHLHPADFPPGMSRKHSRLWCSCMGETVV